MEGEITDHNKSARCVQKIGQIVMGGGELHIDTPRHYYGPVLSCGTLTT